MTDETQAMQAAALRMQFARLSRLNWSRLTKWSIKASEVRLLLVIREHNMRENSAKITVSDISRLLHITSPSVTQMINSLLAGGYVVRAPHPDDRRISEITLTDKGAQVAHEANETFAVVFEGLIDFLGAEQSEQLLRGLEQSAVYFKKIRKDWINAVDEQNPRP